MNWGGAAGVKLGIDGRVRWMLKNANDWLWREDGKQ